MSAKYNIGDTVWFNTSNVAKSMLEYEESMGVICGIASFHGQYMDGLYVKPTHKYEIIDSGKRRHIVLEKHIFNTQQEAIDAQ